MDIACTPTLLPPRAFASVPQLPDHGLSDRPFVPYIMDLYVGRNFASIKAIAIIQDLCDRYLPQQFQLRVMDVYEHPEETEAAKIVMTPTLIRQQPLPRKEIVGSLDDISTVKQILGFNGLSQGSAKHPKCIH